MNLPHNVTVTEACPITAFVITLGKHLLQEKVKDWPDMDTTARFSKDQGIQLAGKQPGSRELETALRSFFQSSGEYYGSDVNVDGYERPKGWDRPFMIRAYPYRKGQHSPITPPYELDGAGPVTACSD